MVYRMRPRDKVPRLVEAFHEDLGLSSSEIVAFWQALVRTKDPEVQALRFTLLQLDGLTGQPGALSRLMATLPPKRYIGLLEKLVAEQPACRRIATKAEEGVLRWTSKRGEWLIEIIERPHAS